MENKRNQHEKNQRNEDATNLAIDIKASEINAKDINEVQEVQAKQIASLLDTHADRLNMRTLMQLENGREQAVKVHKHLNGTINRDGTINGMVNWAEHHRFVAAGMVLAAIIAGFALTQAFSPNVEHGDAFLLAAELPPEAFVDTAFEPSLNTTQAKL